MTTSLKLFAAFKKKLNIYLGQYRFVLTPPPRAKFFYCSTLVYYGKIFLPYILFLSLILNPSYMPTLPQSSTDNTFKLIVIVLFCLLAAGFLYAGVGLVYSGIKGDWLISMEWQGWKLYASSIFPGLSVVFGGIALVIWGLPNALKKFR